jgi:hypothetical protein
MKKLSLSLILTLVAAVILFPFLSEARKATTSINEVVVAVSNNNEAEVSLSSLYDSLDLGSKGLSKEAFTTALNGYNKLLASGKITNSKLTIADFSQASTKNRLYVIDLKSKKLLFNTMVAHGKNSGELMATRFSNTNESNQSSLGFYVTGEKYQGKHGLSMRLDGMEATNSNARERAIVMHAADYVNEGFAKARGYIGRSWGCPAVSPELNEPIIKEIGNGS